MNIIKFGNIYQEQIICSNCDTVFSCTIAETMPPSVVIGYEQPGSTYQIWCPGCGALIHRSIDRNHPWYGRCKI